MVVQAGSALLTSTASLLACGGRAVLPVEARTFLEVVQVVAVVLIQNVSLR